MLNQVKAVVFKGHTLGLLGESFGQPSIEVLRTKAKGGTSTGHSENIYYVDSSEYRQATIADFVEYRVAHSNAYLINEDSIVPGTNKLTPVIYKEHTFGVLGQRSGNPFIEVLRTNARNWSAIKSGETIDNIAGEDYRTATLADFEEYAINHSDNYITG
jgi:hypothetical protein